MFGNDRYDDRLDDYDRYDDGPRGRGRGHGRGRSAGRGSGRGGYDRYDDRYDDGGGDLLEDLIPWAFAAFLAIGALTFITNWLDNKFGWGLTQWFKDLLGGLGSEASISMFSTFLG